MRIKMLLKIVLLFTVYSLLFTVVTGCSNKEDINKKGKVVIKYMNWGTPKEIAMYEEWIKEFCEKEKDIYIEKIFSAGGQAYNEKLMTMIAGDTPPDLACYAMNIGLIKMAEKGQVVDLTDYIKKDKFDISVFYPQLTSMVTIDDKIYALPNNSSTYFIYYNKDIFDKNNQPYPDDKWDWNKLKEVAKKLTKDFNNDGRIDQYGINIDTGLVPLLSFIWQAEGDFFKIDPNTRDVTAVLNKSPYKENNISAIKFIRDMMQEKIAPTVRQLKESGGSIDYFEQGKVAMKYSGGWELNRYAPNKKLRWGIASLPKGKIKANLFLNFVYFIPKGAKHPDEAWKFLKFLSSKEMNMKLGNSGRTLPARRDVVDDKNYLKDTYLSSIDANVIRKELKIARPGPFIYISGEVEDIIATELEKIFLLDDNIEEALNRANNAIEKKLRENK